MTEHVDYWVVAEEHCENAHLGVINGDCTHNRLFFRHRAAAERVAEALTPDTDRRWVAVAVELPR